MVMCTELNPSLEETIEINRTYQALLISYTIPHMDVLK